MENKKVYANFNGVNYSRQVGNYDSVDLIKEYVASNLSSEQFCTKKKISVNWFKRASDYVRAKDKDLYEKFNQKQEVLKKVAYEELDKVVPNIIEGIKKGVKHNGENTPFDIFDYYDYTRVSLSYLYTYCKEKYLSEINKVRKFIEKSIDKDMINLDSFYNERNSFLIAGEQREITVEEKKDIVAYLLEHDMPINYAVCRQAMIRIANGRLLETKKNSHQL